MATRPRRRQAVLALANLLMLIGGVVIGSTIAIAAREGDREVRDASIATARSPAPPAASPAVTLQPLPTEPLHTATRPSETDGPTLTHHPHKPLPATPQPTPDPPLQQLPRSGDGLIMPVPALTPPAGPYAMNVAGRRAIHITVPAVGIDADVVEVDPVAVQIGQQTAFEWPAADWAAGHHSTSANPGQGGNIVIAGHDDVRGEVFRGLHDVKIGDQVIVETENMTYTYVVQEIHLRLYTNASLDEQLAVGGFIGPMPEERVTLVTCWPYLVDTHRLIVVAKPID